MLGIVIEHAATEHAHVLFEETVVQGRRVDPGRADGYVRSNLAYLARLTGDLDEARSHLLDAVEAFRDRIDPDGEALALNHLGCVLREQEDFDAGRDALSASLKIRQELGDRRGTGLSIGNLALLSAAAGDVAAARVQLQQALRWFEETEDAPGVAGSMLSLAAVNLRSGDTASARRLIEAVLPGLPKIPGYHRATGWALATLAHARRRDGDRAAAATALRRAADVFAGLGATDGLAHCSRLQRNL